MKPQPTPCEGYHRTNLSSLTRIAAFVALVALIGIPLFSSSSASSSKQARISQPSAANEIHPAAVGSNQKSEVAGQIGSLAASDRATLAPWSSSTFGTLLPLPVPQPSPETIATFAADCTTPKSAFLLGETVCAQTDNVDLNFPGGRWVHWLRPNLSIAFGGSGTTLITMNPQTFTFVPDTTGTWKVTIAQTDDISQTPAIFTVSQTAPIATYAANCTTPKTLFNLGDTVCARAQGFDPAFNRRFAWIDPAGLVRNFVPITTDPQTDFFTLPATETSLIDIFVVDNRGTWKVNVVTSRGSQLASAPFQVQGASPRADLSIGKGIIGGSPDSGTDFSYSISITNFGPNDAANVVLTDPQPANATFVSPVVQTSGPMFSCSGSNPVVCTRVAGLAVGESATFQLTYTAGAAGATITNVATVSSDTAELNNDDNTASSGRVSIGAGGGTPPTCTLECPQDITTATNTTGGANVTVGSPNTFGTCGTINTDHPSSFFPIGTTTVHLTSSTGGGSCTFNVTVIDSPSPTITCPANQTVQAPSGQSEVSVSVGTPTASGGTTISSERSDERPVSDPYPVGTTFITWTATDSFGRQANCTQTIIVTSPDAPTITCPSDKTFTAPTGSCIFTATAAQIGTPTTTGPGVTVTNERSDGEALTAAYPAGQTFITWTATNSVGIAACTQKITVIATDNMPPTLTVPPNVNATTSTCSATLDDELGVATAEDNCTASVDITRTGVPRVACPIPGDPGRTCESFVFPTGTTVVTYTAKDAAGNTTVGTQLVTVLESPAIPPTITAPAAVTLYTGAGATSCSVTVSSLDTTLGTATANDNCPGVTVARSNVPAGNVFPLGNTTITYTATDKSGNMASDTQVVTVVDNTPPVVTAPGPVTLFTGLGATSCSVTVSNLDVTLGTGSATDNCTGVGAVTRSGVPSGNVFPVGDTIVTYSATDAHNNTGTATQKVTVIDDTRPTISCPANITLEPTCPSGAIATYAPPVVGDNCGVQGTSATTSPTPNLASGLVFPIGTTTVTNTVTDIHGNSNSCSFTVTVKTPQAVIQDMMSRVQALQPPLSGTQVQGLLSKLQAALDAINQGKMNVACNKLADFINQVTAYIGNGTLTSAQGQPLIDSANHVRNTIGCTNNPCT